MSRAQAVQALAVIAATFAVIAFVTGFIVPAAALMGGNLALGVWLSAFFVWITDPDTHVLMLPC